MKVIAVEKAEMSLPELAKLAQDGTVILTCKGKPLVAVKDLAGCDWESIALANNPRFIALIEESRRQYREQGGISLEDLRKELGLRPAPRRRSAKKASARR
jgi:hypothetical protein